MQSEALRPDQTSCCHRHVSVCVLMSEIASFLFLAGINLLSSSIGCPFNRNEEPNWSILCKNIPILLLFPPRKWASAAATGWSQPEGEKKEGNRKFNFATERPCGCCNHHRCTTHFYWRVFHPNSPQMCLRDAAGKVLSCKNVGKKATNLGCLFYQFIYLFILPSFERSLRENGTTWLVHPLQCCGNKDTSAKKLQLLCLSVYLLAWSWNLNNVTCRPVQLISERRQPLSQLASESLGSRMEREAENEDGMEEGEKKRAYEERLCLGKCHK